VAIELDAEQIPHLALIPVGIGPDRHGARQSQIILRQRHLDAQIAVALDRQQMIENREIGLRQPGPLRAQPLVDRTQVIEHHIGLRQLPQMAQQVEQPLARHPQRGEFIEGGLKNQLDIGKACAAAHAPPDAGPRMPSVRRALGRLIESSFR
jgi:hypothetical protein